MLRDPSDVLALLGDELEPAELRLKDTLAHSERPPTHVYFPVSGVVSMVNQPEPGEIVEFATVGHEGFVGLSQLLGADSLPSETFVQIPGRGFRLKSRVFTTFVDRQPAFRALLMRYIVA